ncbi:MAG: urea carboxylase-associated family protein [Synergistaceae bacterium]|nr:urea carboxylase-associated family protein [Synergistaceae bacterium]
MKGFFYRREIRVPGGYARAFEVEKGSRITVIDLEGRQVAAFVAFNRDRVSETFSTAHTRLALSSVRIKVGDVLRSNLLRPMLEVTEDTAQTHDLLMPACDAHRDGAPPQDNGYRSCAVNFEDALAPWGISRSIVPEPLNIFGNTHIESNGTLTCLPPISRPGDRLSLKALLPLVCAVSACPRGPGGTWKGTVTDIAVIVSLGDEQGKG